MCYLITMTTSAYLERLGQTLQSYRKLKKLTQTELANAIGVAQATVSKFEAGKLVPSIEDWLKLSFALGFDFKLPEMPAQEEAQPAQEQRRA